MHNVPLFPDFRPITLNDKNWYNDFFKVFRPYADFSFGNLMVWLNQNDDLQISQLNDNLVIKATVLFMDNQMIVTFIGTHKIVHTAHALLEHMQQIGLEPKLLGIPEVVIRHMGYGHHTIKLTEDIDDNEYIYHTKQFVDLDGSKYSRLRREITTFERQFPNRRIEEHDLADKTSCDFLRNQLYSWDKAFSTNLTSRQEMPVIDATFMYGAVIGYRNYSLYVDDQLAGFILYQTLPQQDCVIINHIKASYEFRYTFDYIFIEFARDMFKRGVDFINFEQDLGIAGLREHKMALRPFTFLRKYTLESQTS
jgi:hypothetical protein